MEMRYKQRFERFWSVVVALFMICSCQSDNPNGGDTEPLTVTFSEDDLIYETSVGVVVTIEAVVSNATNASYSWSYEQEVVSRESWIDFSSEEVGQHFVTFALEADNGSCVRELRVDVSEPTPPEVTFPLVDGVVVGYVGREIEIAPTYKYCDEQSSYQWYVDGVEAGTDSTLTLTKWEAEEYALRLEVESSGGAVAVGATLRVETLPTLSLDFDQELYYVAQGETIVLSPFVSYDDSSTEYSWSVDGVAQGLPSQRYLKFTPSAMGDYTVKIASGNVESSTVVMCVEAIDHQRAITQQSSNNVEIFEFTPAPGQFVNNGYVASTAVEAAAYAESRLNSNSYLSLGGWGGYVVVGFDHSVLNVEGVADLWIGGNATSTSNEPATVWVMQDVNGDSLPNDIWYELKGSEYGKTETDQDYAITYYRGEDGESVVWQDNAYNTGTIDQAGAYSQNYYPYWIEESSYTIRGTKIKSRTENLSSDAANESWSNLPFDWGYVDNIGVDYLDFGVALELDNAVKRDGTAADLKYIDFVKVQTAVNAKAGWLGEVSPEITGFKNLNL